VYVTQDLTLTAIFERMALIYTVTFYPRNGEKPFTEKVTENGYITEPTAPLKEDYVFKGWYTDSTLFETYWRFSADTVTDDLALYAKWLLVDTNLFDLYIPGIDLVPQFDPYTTSYIVQMPCPPESTQLEIIATPVEGVAVEYGGVADSLGTFTIKSDSAGDYIVTVKSVAQNGGYKVYTITVRQNLPSNLLRRLWNDAIAVNLNTHTNGGYTFTDFMWFFNNTPVGNGKYLYLPEGLKNNGSYHVVLTTATGEELETCPYIYDERSEAGLSIASNPVSRGSVMKIQLPSQKHDLHITDLQGRVLQTVSAEQQQTSTEISIPVNLSDGVYMLRYGMETIKIVVK
jgi:uncharacterized repeat protein (TIGR02543 family)